jgi:hypothetical protein
MWTLFIIPYAALWLNPVSWQTHQRANLQCGV